LLIEVDKEAFENYFNNEDKLMGLAERIASRQRKKAKYPNQKVEQIQLTF